MATPTGYRFLDTDGIVKDFVDVFDTNVPGTLITGYKSAAYNLDLGQIFSTTTGGTIATFYKNPNGQDLGSILKKKQPFTTNGTVSDTNPFVTSAPNNGYTYILFGSTPASYYFNTNKVIPRLYYMIVGAGGSGQKGNASGTVPGAGGGAGGCLNSYIDDFSITNYTITIPDLGDGKYTEITNNSTLSLIAQNGIFITRGSVSLNSTVLIPASSTPREQGVGGSGGQAAGSRPGGSVYTGNYLTFLGDGLVSNTYFGGGGGSGAGNNVNSGNNNNGGNGGGGGGGAGLDILNNQGNGGIGTNGNNGLATVGSTVGGNAFNSIGQGYGGGGGGGGSSSASSSGGLGGTGGGAILLLYFQSF
jgi:hypothetical protein